MFKKNIKVLLAVFFTALLSCHGGYSPSAVAESFLKAFEQKKYSEAKKYCSPETVKLVEIAESLSKMSNANLEYAGKKYEVLSQEITGDKAIVKFRETGTTEVEKMGLKKVNGQWLVSISKEDIMAKQNTDKYSDTEKESSLNDSITISK